MMPQNQLDSQVPRKVVVGDHAAMSKPKELVNDDPTKTTVMWRNLPNNYGRDGLLELLNNEGFAGSYNFFYSPVDFSSNALLGYAFVNFVSHDEANRFLGHFQGYSRWNMGSG